MKRNKRHRFSSSKQMLQYGTRNGIGPFASKWPRLTQKSDLQISVDLGKGGKMPYYKTCPRCGAALDPGEICDCREDRQHKTSTKTAQKTQEKTAPDATNIESGEADHELSDPRSASHFNEYIGGNQV